MGPSMAVSYTHLDVYKRQAQYNLGFMYEQGRGVPQDYNQAVDWYRKAAEQNEAAAQYSLGLMYDQGTGVPRNLSEANRWYNLAAKNGDPDARSVVRAQNNKPQQARKAAPANRQQKRDKKQ